MPQVWRAIGCRGWDCGSSGPVAYHQIHPGAIAIRDLRRRPPICESGDATILTMANDTYLVERAVTIEASPARVYEQIISFRSWTAWSPWEDLDPELKRTYSGSGSGVGAVYAWSGNRKAGQGRMTITDASEPSRVEIDLLFEKPFKARNNYRVHHRA